MADIYDMAEKLGKYQKNVHMRMPGAKQALEEFKAARIDYVASILEVSMCERSGISF